MPPLHCHYAEFLRSLWGLFGFLSLVAFWVAEIRAHLLGKAFVVPWYLTALGFAFPYLYISLGLWSLTQTHVLPQRLLMPPWFWYTTSGLFLLLAMVMGYAINRHRFLFALNVPYDIFRQIVMQAVREPHTDWREITQEAMQRRWWKRPCPRRGGKINVYKAAGPEVYMMHRGKKPSAVFMVRGKGDRKQADKLLHAIINALRGVQSSRHIRSVLWGCLFLLCLLAVVVSQIISMMRCL